MKKTIKTIAIALATAAALMNASAQNITITGTGNTTTWSGAPTLQTGLPTVFTVTENAYTGSPSVLPMLGQTFTATASGTLAGIHIFGSGAPGDNYVFLWDLGLASSYTGVSGASVDAALQNLSGYPAYANLFSVGSFFHFNGGATQSEKVLTFAPDNSAISINAGDLYYFGIAPNLTSAVMTWMRVSSDPYAGGAAYREGGLLNGAPGIRDFALAVDIAPVPEPSTVALMSLFGGAALLGLKRNRRS